MKGPFGAFCAVGNPESFFTHLRRQGLELCLKRAFPDHHVYQQSDIDTISLESKKAGARSLVTTEKDAVKLRGLRFSLPCHVLQIDISIDEEPQLLDLIRTATA
jgi:tetraacyldisaccharide 4'-kinase